MCGICGFYYSDSRPTERPALDRMVSAIRHRGPDATGTYLDDGIALGHARLSIQDLSERGAQPMHGNGWVVVYNGEIYNAPELRNELERSGVVFRSTSDTEVLLELFSRDGVGCLRRLNGIFAAALYSTRDRTLYLVRDQIGVKPLYYCFRDGGLEFASDPRALLAIRAESPDLNPRGFANFFAFGHAVGAETIYRGIYKLPPGSWLKVTPRGPDTRVYWQLPVVPESDMIRDLPEACSRIESAFVAAVRRQMLSDVPVGAFLSGGLDSTAIVTRMVRESGTPIQTFTVGYDGQSTFNEFGAAAQTATCLHTEHRELCITQDDLAGALDEMVWQYGEPFGDDAGLPLFLLSRFARNHVKVVLCGEGGDELFGGYRRYTADSFHRYYRFLPNWLRRSARSIAGALPRARRTKRTLGTLCIDNDAERHCSWLRVYPRDSFSDLFAPETDEWLEDFDADEEYRAVARSYASLPGSGRMLATEFSTWLPDCYLEKTDKATMAVGLEARVPFLDIDLVELSARIHPLLKVQGLRRKIVIRSALQGMVPSALLNRPKRGLAVPTDPWFRGALKPFVRDVLLDRKTLSRGYFQARYLEDLLQSHESGRECRQDQIWLLLVFELWHRRFIDCFQPAEAIPC